MRGDKNSKSLSGPALEKALSEEQFKRPPVPLVGMVKSSDKPNHISFALAGCESWVDLPSAMIKEAHHLGHQACHGHSHPIFRLSLQEPKDPMAKVLMGLLDGAARSFVTAPQRGPAGFSVGLGPHRSDLISVGQIINDRAGHSACQQMCFDYGTSHPFFGRCTDLCDCIYLDGKNIFQCMNEMINRARELER